MQPRPHLPLSLSFALALLAPQHASAQLVDQRLWVPNGAVSGIARTGDTIYLGGAFSIVGPATGGAVWLDPATGAVIAPYPRVVGEVDCAVADGAGGWYVGGQFSAVEGHPRSSLAHVLADGSLSDFAPALSYAGSPASIVTMALVGKTLYIGGYIDRVGGVPRGDVAAVDATTGAATGWSPAPEMGGVTCIAADAGGVYVGGSFAPPDGGSTTPSLAKLDPVTATRVWEAHPDIGVATLLLSGNTLYVGGGFASIAGQARNCLAALRTTNGTTLPWYPSGLDPTSNYVEALALSGTTLYIGGSFTAVTGQSRTNLAAVDASSAALLPWAPVPDRAVVALAVDGVVVYAGGNFRAINGQSRSRLAAMDATTGAVTPWDPRASSTVMTVVATGGRVFAGGFFNSMGGVFRNRLAALDANTGAALPWDPNADNRVDALALGDGAVYVGGLFANVGGQPRSRLAAIDPSTGAILPWNPGADADPHVLLAHGSTVYAGGEFTHVGGLARSKVAAIDATTGVVTAWHPDAGSNSTPFVGELVAAPGVVYVGGQYQSIGGAARASLAAVDSATGLATPWNPGATSYQCSPLDIRAMAIEAGRLYVAGCFQEIGGQARNGLAALDLVTAHATPWDPDFANVPPSVEVFAPGDHQIFVGGGGFGPQDAVEPYRLAALDDETAQVAPWDLDVTGSVPTILPYGNELYFGGGYQSVNGLPYGLFTGLVLDATTPALLVRFDAVRTEAGVRLEWEVGDGARVADARLERAALAAGPWSALALDVRRDGALASVTDPGADATRQYYRLVLRLAGGTSSTFGPVQVEALAPGRDGLTRVTPNPARGAVRIGYALSRADRVRLDVLDVAGRRVESIVDASQRAGEYAVVWDGASRLRTGLYFVRWRSGDRTMQRAITLVR